MKKAPVNREQFARGLSVLLLRAYSFTRRREAGRQDDCTANATEQALDDNYSELATTNAVTLGEQPADGWYLISGLGDFAGPNGDRVQVFHFDQARDVVSTFNSIAGRAGRFFKNAMSGRFGKWSVPIFEGHPDQNPQRWPRMNLLGEITDLKADDGGLWGLVTWNSAGLARRTVEHGPLKPSPYFWHEPADAQGRVFPTLLESVGLVVVPNIRTAPVWTANALPAAPDETKQNHMNHREQLIALLGLKSDATDAAIQSSLDAHSLKVTTTANALAAAETAKGELETQLSTANAQVTTLTTERDQLQTTNATLTAERDDLKTANAALTTERDEFRKGLLDLAEKTGAVTPAERATYDGKLATANSRASTITDLVGEAGKPARKAMSTTSIELDGKRHDLSTANARQALIGDAVSAAMSARQCDYHTAYAAVKADPKYAAVFAAMSDPTKAA